MVANFTVWHKNRTKYSRNKQNNNYITTDICLEEVRAIIKKFKNNKARGPDEIPMEFFKWLDDEIYPH